MWHKSWKLPLSFWATRLAWAVVVLFTSAVNTNAQETLQPYAPPILHTFLDSANVYPESVTIDQSSGTFFVGSVKEGTIYKGKIGRPSLEVFSPGRCGWSQYRDGNVFREQSSCRSRAADRLDLCLQHQNRSSHFEAG